MQYTCIWIEIIHSGITLKITLLYETCIYHHSSFYLIIMTYRDIQNTERNFAVTSHEDEIRGVVRKCNVWPKLPFQPLFCVFYRVLDDRDISRVYSNSENVFMSCCDPWEFHASSSISHANHQLSLAHVLAICEMPTNILGPTNDDIPEKKQRWK